MNTSTQALSRIFSAFFWSVVFIVFALIMNIPESKADSVQIQNVIQTRTSTGDNTVTDGKTITTGQSSNGVSVSTVENGKYIEVYYASSSDPIEFTSTYTANDRSVVAASSTRELFLKAQEDLRQLHEIQRIQGKVRTEIDQQVKAVRKNKVQNSGAQPALAAHSNSGIASSSSMLEKKDAHATRITLHGFKTLVSNIFAYVHIWISR